jgi:hypothetical protein
VRFYYKPYFKTIQLVYVHCESKHKKVRRSAEALERAIAGDKNRSRATSHRRSANAHLNGGVGPRGASFQIIRAKEEDMLAEQLEEEVGQQLNASLANLTEV